MIFNGFAISSRALAHMSDALIVETKFYTSLPREGAPPDYCPAGKRATKMKRDVFLSSTNNDHHSTFKVLQF